jgi:trigger factor
VDGELTEAATEGVKIQLVLDTLAEKEEIQVSDEEFSHEIVHRAQRLGVAPQEYYDQLIRSGVAAAVFGDVRRGKALALLLERVTVTDSAGNPVSVDELRGSGEADDHEGHDHEGHDHEGHDHEGHDHEGHDHD